MKLSIIVPMYNVEKYIDNCINSLLNQNINRDQYEIIIVDDGSTDNSKEIVLKYKQNNSNIKVISVKNGGLSYARNIGINNSKGEYLVFVDSDDYIADNSLGEMLELAINNKLDMLFFDILRVKDNDNHKFRYKNLQSLNIVSGIKYFEENNVNNGAWHFFISRDFVIRNNLRFVEGRLCEDGMFLVSSIFKAQRVSHCGVDVYRYVTRQNSITSKKTPEHLCKVIDDFLYAIEYINRYYEDSIKQGLSYAFIKRLKSRRNSYIFFMQIRMIKAKLGYHHCKKTLEQLKKINCYKYERMRKDEYGDIKTTIIWMILNNKPIFSLLCLNIQDLVRVVKWAF